MRRIPLLAALVIGLSLMACDPDPSSIPECEGVDVADLHCGNTYERYSSGDVQAEVECYQAYCEACGLRCTLL